MFRLWHLVPLTLFLSPVSQQGWSIAQQKARINREDDEFYRRLPNVAKKRQKAIGLYLSQPYSERILDGWKPSYEPSQAPTTLKTRSGAKVEGRWKRMQGKLGAAFRITEQGGHYFVKFATWDGKGSETFFRHGDLHGAVLKLDRPVFDVIEHPFTKIYVVAAGKEVRLLPSSDVALLDRVGGTPIRARAIAGLTFHRV
jgi:hypothetical protein